MKNKQLKKSINRNGQHLTKERDLRDKYLCLDQ